MADRSKAGQSARRGHLRASVEQAVSAYYSELPSERRVEQTMWAEFAFAELQARRLDMTLVDDADSASRA